MGTEVLALTLPQLDNLLKDRIDGGFALIDRTVYTGDRPAFRTIELRHRSWNGTLLGGFAEYPTMPQPLVFRPNSDMAYGLLGPVVRVLERLGVRIDETT